MARASYAPVLVAVSLALCSTESFAQATIRPLPRVARAWESAAIPASAPGPGTPDPATPRGKIVPASSRVDLDFIGPLDFDQVRAEAEPVSATSTEIVDLHLFGMGLGSSSFQGGSGSLTTQRGGWEISLGEYRERGFSFAVELGTEASFYDFGGGSSPVPGVGDPFNDVYDTHLAGRFLHETDSRFDFYGGLQVGNSGEDAVGIDDSIYVGGALALRYEARPQLALLVGIAGMSRFDDSPWILPYIGFDWRVNEDLRIKTEAAEIHADYRLSDDWSFGLEAIYDFRQFRLNQNGPLNAGSFRDEEIRAGASLEYRLADGVALEVQAGKVLWREVLFHDGTAGELGETELSSPVYAGLALTVSF